MAPLACLMHWYISMLFVAPVVAVGGWCWFSTKRMAKHKQGSQTRRSDAAPTAAHFETS